MDMAAMITKLFVKNGMIFAFMLLGIIMFVAYKLGGLTKADFVRILSDTEASLTRQYVALMGTEGVALSFTPGLCRTGDGKMLTGWRAALVPAAGSALEGCGWER